MKQKIDPSEIKPGDVIRWEAGESTHWPAHAVEYTASKSCLPWKLSGQHYLLERPEPPFEPYWGMVIGSPRWCESNERAVYINDTRSSVSWLCYTGEWVTDDWAKRKLAEGWVVIAPPEREEGAR